MRMGNRRVAIIGGGHVGVVHAAGLASLGHEVTVIETDPDRVAQLQEGHVWFHEPGLEDLLRSGLEAGRVTVTGDYRAGLRGREFALLCVPSPITEDGTLDDSFVASALRSIVTNADDGAPGLILVNKSTVAVGTGDTVDAMVADSGILVASNPEFLAEGRALQDFFHPARIVIGSRSSDVAAKVAGLYEDIDAPVLTTDMVTAELIKLGSNSFLATKISFANSLADIGRRLGADVATLARGLGLDPRIGSGHLAPGLGYGGSCLPKDLAALEHLARGVGAPYDLLAAAAAVNRYQRSRVIDHLRQRLGQLREVRIAILGAAFKPGTDDLRESPAVQLARELVELHATVSIWDPQVRRDLIASAIPGADVAASAVDAVRGADAIVAATEWPDVAALDLGALRRESRGNVLIDGRGIFTAACAREAGFEYFGLGAS